MSCTPPGLQVYARGTHLKGVSPDTYYARGYEYCETPAQLEFGLRSAGFGVEREVCTRLGALILEEGMFTQYEQEAFHLHVTLRDRTAKLSADWHLLHFPLLLIPHYWERRLNGFQLRFEDPPCNADGEPMKYWSPRGWDQSIDVPPAFWDAVYDPTTALWVTEGSKKADACASRFLATEACCVSVQSVSGWSTRGPGRIGSRILKAQWRSIPLKDRKVVIGFDTDAATNPNVYREMRMFEMQLMMRGAKLFRWGWLQEALEFEEQRKKDERQRVEDDFWFGRGEETV